MGQTNTTTKGNYLAFSMLQGDKFYGNKTELN